MTLWKGFDGGHTPDFMKSTPQRHVKEEGMKVTAKKPCVSDVYEVVDKSSQFYIVKDACGFLIVLSKADFEPVQEWKDVTVDCYLLEDGFGHYSLFHYACAIHADDPQYRVTIQGNSFKVEYKS